jgi:hypothetical protein
MHAQRRDGSQVASLGRACHQQRPTWVTSLWLYHGRYVNMDASWDLPDRDANGNFVPNPALW